MKIISTASIKGGTGKTTVLLLVSRAIASTGKKCLIIDLDVNNSASRAFMPQNVREYDLMGKKNAAAALLSTEDDFLEYIVPSIVPNIDILRSHPQLTRVNFTQMLLKNKIQKSSLAEEYDYVFIDTPATYYSLHVMAYQVSDIILTPVNPSQFDFSPLQQLGINIQEDIGVEKLENWKIVFNKVKPENQTSQKDYFQLYENNFSKYIVNPKIPDTVKTRECIDRNQLTEPGLFPRGLHARIICDDGCMRCGLHAERLEGFKGSPLRTPVRVVPGHAHILGRLQHDRR